MIPYRIGFISPGEAVLSARACENLTDEEIVSAVREAIDLCKRPELADAKNQGVEFRSVRAFEEWARQWRKNQDEWEQHRKSLPYLRGQFTNMNPSARTLLKRRGDREECSICGAADRITVDHIKPLARGGTNDIDNLRFLCAPCNSAKGTREGVDDEIRRRRSAA